MSKILITGSAHGLGAAMKQSLLEDGHIVFPFDHEQGKDVREPEAGPPPPKGLDVLINCAGVNYTGWLEDFAESEWDEVLDVNVKGIFKMVKWALPELIASKGTVLNIVSNASHVPMTCSAAYNASKGAAHILTLQMARELTKKHGITVFGISPNKLKGTQMSRAIERQVIEQRGWTAKFAAEYQAKALLAGEETDPAELAKFVAYLLQSKQRHKFLTGCVLNYGA